MTTCVNACIYKGIYVSICACIYASIMTYDDSPYIRSHFVSQRRLTLVSMAIPFGEHPGGMMVHIYWWPQITPTGGIVTRICTSTAASNELGYGHMRIDDHPSMLPSCVFGPHAAGVYRGTLKEVYPDGPVVQDALAYLKAVHPPGMSFWRAYAGYSLTHPDVSWLWHAVDWYYQDPQMLQSGVYHHWVLEDETDPVWWSRARRIKIIGRVLLKDERIDRPYRPARL